MAWEGYRMFGVSTATLGGMGWVFIATPHKLVVTVQKLDIMTYKGVARPFVRYCHSS